MALRKAKRCRAALSRSIHWNEVLDLYSFRRANAVALGNGDLQLSFLGIPGTNYVLEITHELPPAGVWTELQSKAAAANGFLIFTNTPSLAPTNDFYRVRYVP